MTEYAIGDVQGCYDALQRLLEQIAFNDREDRLWFVGDLVNRGPQSLAVLRFIHRLPIKPCITLGNHDLHLLSHLFSEHPWHNNDDTFHEILKASDRDELGHWLRHQSLLIHDAQLNVVMCHAGIAPCWTLEQAKHAALELEAVLSGDDFLYFLDHMYGNEPNQWDDTLYGLPRWRFICNAFTRMRFCDSNGRLILHLKGTIDTADQSLYPWYAAPNRHDIPANLIFGHWAALQGQCPNPRIQAIDTGCFWGGSLTALRLHDNVRFSHTCALTQ